MDVPWGGGGGGGGDRATFPSIFCIFCPNLIKLVGDMVLWANIQIMVKKGIYFADVSKNQQKTDFLHGGGNFAPFPSKCHRQQKIGLTPSHKAQIIVLTPKSTVSPSFAISLDSFSDHAISACCNCRGFCRLQSLCYLALYIPYS